MGLRERNAARTREMIIDTALSLFLSRGYEATKMEDVAEAAGIGTSTLYRYFPTKDLLVIDPLAFRGKLAEGLRARPAEESIEVALGRTMLELFTQPRGDAERLRRLRAVVDSSSGPRMRLLEEFVKERTLLESVIAERLGRQPQDVFCVMTARLAAAMLEYLAELTWDLHFTDEVAGNRQVTEVFERVTREMKAQPPAVPALS